MNLKINEIKERISDLKKLLFKLKGKIEIDISISYQYEKEIKRLENILSIKLEEIKKLKMINQFNLLY